VYGLRLEGKAEYLTNFLDTVRPGSGVDALTGLTGSGGVLTLAATDTSGSMTIANGPANNPNGIRLGFIGDLGFTYILNAGTVANFGGLLVKQGRVKLGNGLDMTGKNFAWAMKAPQPWLWTTLRRDHEPVGACWDTVLKWHYRRQWRG